jgi:two-component sensor histidine kinase
VGIDDLYCLGVLEHGSENELLFLDAGGMACTVNPSLPMPIRGLREHAYTSGRVVIDNAFMKGEWIKFLPEGHGILSNVLFAPLAIEGKVVGIMGLANKPVDFTREDMAISKDLGIIAATALKNSRTKEMLENSEHELRQLLGQKDMLMKEVHHRIKNMLNTMNGLLSLQVATLQDSATLAVIQEIQGRFYGMALLYDQLYQSDGHASGSVRAYLDRLVERLVGLFPNACNVVTELRIDDIPLEARRLSSLGLIVNELVTNAMKYAFGGNRTGRLSVQVKKYSGKITLTVADDGPGMPAAIQHIVRSPGSPMDAGMTSLGLSIIFALVQQLEGTIEFAHESGTTVKLVFPA